MWIEEWNNVLNEMKLYLKPPTNLRDLYKYPLSRNFKPSNYNIEFMDAILKPELRNELKGVFNNCGVRPNTKISDNYEEREMPQESIAPLNVKLDFKYKDICSYEDGKYLSFRPCYGTSAMMYNKFIVDVYNKDLAIDFLPIFIKGEPFRVFVKKNHSLNVPYDILEYYAICFPDPFGSIVSIHV